jgi:EAL domain-containing protein (putative c-di-GMP-specific phosphodiesterase class I)
MLSEFRMPPECLGVELTESVIMSDPALALKVLQNLRKLGITTALDDFGTGYSSLSYLRQLPLTCLKVDRSFTAALTDDEHSRSLTQAIIRMADSLTMATIAEGVETPAQLQWLVEHDCNIGQGFLFSHPVPAAAVHRTVDRIESAWRTAH